MHKMKGKFFLMCYGLINEFNPEVIAKVQDQIALKIEDVQLEEFYDAEILKSILRELSPAAQEVIGKNIMPTINKTTGAFNEINDPAQIFQMLPVIYLDNNIDDEGGDLGKYYPPEVEEGKAIIKENSHWPCDFNRGIMIGIVQVTGVRANIRARVEKIDESGEYPTNIHTLVWG